LSAKVESSRISPLLQRSKSAIMGIINTTPDSFSDGGDFFSHSQAVAHGLRLIDEGADILDIGGESTRPGAVQVSLQEELDRVMPVIEQLRADTDIALSIDTYKPQVMQAALAAGVDMVNDINALQAPGASSIVAEDGIPVCLMHMQGKPHSMQLNPSYKNAVDEVIQFFETRVETCLAAGIEKHNIILDPGIGFGKELKHNLLLLKALPEIKQRTACELLIGVSRKSLIDKLFGRAVSERLPASLGMAVQAVLNGVKIVRAHDVQATFDAIRSVEAVRDA